LCDIFTIVYYNNKQMTSVTSPPLAGPELLHRYPCRRLRLWLWLRTAPPFVR